MTTTRLQGRHADRETRLTPDQIRDHPLATALLGLGYAKPDVRRVLAAVADQVQVMQGDIDALWRTVKHREAELELRRYGIGLPARPTETGIDELALRWQIEAQRYSDDITATAQRQAADIVEQARHQAEQVLAEIDLDTYEQAIAEVNRLRRTVTGLHRWIADMRRYVDAAHDGLTSELAGLIRADERRAEGHP
jgi:cell division septum initiation protein DivIVA